MTTPSESIAVVQRLCAATNAHDIDGIVACFAVDYRNETPAHPERGFVGSDQVRRNWTQILGAIPDIHAEVLRYSVDGNTVWSEWEHSGTRPDGSAHLLRGVILFEVVHGRIAHARFYLEPVEQASGDVNAAVARQVAPGAKS